MIIDIKKLREYLKDYFGTAASNGFPAAMIDVFDVDKASPQELVKIAQRAGINLKEFEEDYER